MKVAYLRISDERKQDAASQRKLAMDMGVLPEHIFEDHGSGSIEPMKRTEFVKLRKFIDEHPDIDELVISEYSRIGRSVWSSLKQLGELITRGIKVTSLSANEKMINSIPPSFQPAVIALMAGSAQEERDRIRERTKWGLENAKAKGKVLGRPVVEIDFQKVRDVMAKYNLREAQAIRVIGYSDSTFYKAKKRLGIQDE